MFKMFEKVLFVFFFLTFTVVIVMACNGYKAKIIRLENCAGDKGIIMADKDFSVKLNKKCELVPTGCINNKAFKTAVAKFKVQKDGMVIKEGKLDLCAAAEQATTEAKNILKLFGAPNYCPVTEEKICSGDYRVDLSKYKAMIGIARGHITVDCKIEHDTGKTCFFAEFEIIKT